MYGSTKDDSATSSRGEENKVGSSSKSCLYFPNGTSECILVLSYLESSTQHPCTTETFSVCIYPIQFLYRKKGYKNESNNICVTSHAYQEKTVGIVACL